MGLPRPGNLSHVPCLIDSYASRPSVPNLWLEVRVPVYRKSRLGSAGLWEVSDLVAMLEADERGLERAA